MSTSKRVGVALAVGGGVLAALGVGLYVRQRRSALSGGLGYARATRQAPTVEQYKSGDMTVKLYSDSDFPIGMRVGIIQDMVDDGLKKGDVRDLANAIVGSGRRTVRVGKYDVSVRGAGCKAGDAYCKADAIGRWTAANVRYSGDIAPVKMGRNGNVEPIDYFSTAKRIVEIGGEDCDGHAALNCTLLNEVSVPCKHRITAPRQFSDWGHIYTMADVGGGRLVALDTTLPGYQTGREARHARKVDFDGVRR